MFERRLHWFLAMVGAVALVILLRLVDLQVLQSAQYEALADRLLTRPTSYLSAPRGAIHDREGRILVGDTATSDISVHYAILPLLTQDGRLTFDKLPRETQAYLAAIVRQLRRQGKYEGLDDATARAQLLTEVEASWSRLASLTGETRDELAREAGLVQARVEAILRVVTRRNPTIHSIQEERTLHPLIHGVEPSVANTVRMELERPWLRVSPSSRRVARDADSVVHLLGRLGEVSPRRIDADPLADDELRELRPGDLCGISGVERLAERYLRGQRGRIVESIDHVIEEHVEPVQGEDVRLTIDLALQQFTLETLKQAVDASVHPCGGAAVVLNARTREVLALVSYPVYAYDRYNEDYDTLRSDARWVPLRSHALQNVYPPGSTCKVIALYGALKEGVVTPTATIDCEGVFRPNLPNAFRCWIYNQYGSVHGPQVATDAIRNSCNIYFYTCGDRLGPERLNGWFRQFGLGSPTGTGLIEEADGIIPDEDWLARNRPSAPAFQPADPWNFAIGQGEISATPLQCANVAATVATGVWEPVKLVYDARGGLIRPPTPERRTFDDGILKTIREGMWRVVNEPGGTAQLAKLDHPDHVLLGKTGSAQAAPRPLTRRWVVAWPDGRQESITGPIERPDFLSRFPPEHRPAIKGYVTQDRFPPAEEKLPSHAWFIGYTQHKDTRRGERARGEVYAICVLIEYGGSGGREAGPVAKAIAERLLENQSAWGRSGDGADLRLAGR